eukprot:146578_1
MILLIHQVLTTPNLQENMDVVNSLSQQMRKEYLTWGYLRTIEQVIKKIIPEDIYFLCNQFLKKHIKSRADIERDEKRKKEQEETERNSIVFLGCGGVGKTSIVHRYIYNQFSDYCDTYEDVYKCHKEVDGQKIRLQILDTIGQGEFYINEWIIYANNFMIVYSITRIDTFYELTRYLEKIKRIKKSEMDMNDVNILLVGNKLDLNDQRTVAYNDVKQLAQTWNCSFIETCAKDGVNVVEAFECLIRAMQENARQKQVISKTKNCCVCL